MRALGQLDERFDDFAVALAQPHSRRDALRIGFGLAAALAASTLPARAFGAPDPCKEFCRQLPPGPERHRCLQDARAGQGLCYQCGPPSTSGEFLCGTSCCAQPNVCCEPGVCTDLVDEQNCGSCGQACAAGETCCPWPPESGFVGGFCADTSRDAAHCGGCFQECPSANDMCCAGVCTDPFTEQNCGACGNVCGPGEACCAGSCTDITNNAGACGGCPPGTACDPGKICVNGQCVCPPDQPPCGGGCCNPGTVCCLGVTGVLNCCPPELVCCESGCCQP